MHEVARFNQTFYPYVCVLFSAECAVRRCTAAGEVTVLGTAVGTCVAGLHGSRAGAAVDALPCY
ncbi:hypothetical protein DB811_06745 [Xanthomonas perforans]|uniref:Uncharacterized protein n=1 Tax=Xanthomonas perforans TaxID=442694 RepID=A0AAQ0YVP3_XANPE|nr:hypothetical protein BJD13_21045 [Xanthomonas perforans]AQS77669.1 hypothetical protein XPE_16675 [Xanthomonas perforans 91-118]AYO94431.1 hypothetical protein Xcom_04820 [Xanthomonas axonopodis pv. commiphoreae]RXD33365.1 hypothetical protein DB757_23580 [Xanthomonas perforans]RXD36388.1 hypothetical protein DB854_09030 [Xanthomonas perforans]